MFNLMSSNFFISDNIASNLSSLTEYMGIMSSFLEEILQVDLLMVVLRLSRLADGCNKLFSIWQLNTEYNLWARTIY